MKDERAQFAIDIYEADRKHKDDPIDLGIHYSYIIADELLAAGYRKPRTITTAGERSALKPGTICMDLKGNAWKRGAGSWVGTGDGAPLFDEDDMTLIVLHEGSQA